MIRFWPFACAVCLMLGLALGWHRDTQAQGPTDDGSIRYPRYTITMLNAVPTLLDAQTGKLWTRVTMELGRWPDGQRDAWVYVDRLDSEAATLAWLARQNAALKPLGPK